MAKLRLEITKGEEIRYISHLDYSRAIERAVRRANLPVAYSEGFNPHMKMAFASALAVGTVSEAEYVDVELAEEAELEWCKNKLAAQLPPGINMKRARYMVTPTPALMAVVNQAAYEVLLPLVSGTSCDVAQEKAGLFNKAEQVVFTKESPKGKREIDIKQYLVDDIEIKNISEPPESCIQVLMNIKITPTGSVKPVEVINALVNMFGLPADKDAALIRRTGLYVADGRKWLAPIDM